MADKTKIEWAEASWNPITGCTPISEGCQNCYAANMAKRFWGDREFSEIQYHPKRLGQPSRWRKPKRIFVCSMGDLFHRYVEQQWIYNIWWEIVSQTVSRHTFIILTKRPENIKDKLMPIANKLNLQDPFTPAQHHRGLQYMWPENVWLGVTAENRKRYHERWAVLQTIPATVKFVSVEPMLNHVNIDDFLQKPDWVICGGETGPGAREMKVEWARDLRDQCKSAGVPFFFKQMSKKAPAPDDLMIREYPKT